MSYATSAEYLVLQEMLGVIKDIKKELKALTKIVNAIERGE